MIQKRFSIVLLFLLTNLAVATEPEVLCYERFDNEIYLMTGEADDDSTCQGMLMDGTVGMCFRGSAGHVAELLNSGVFEYSYRRINVGTAEVVSDNIIQYGSTIGRPVPETRYSNEIFRCPEFANIKSYTERLADQMESSVEYALSHMYRKHFGEPFWFDKR